MKMKFETVMVTPWTQNKPWHMTLEIKVRAFGTGTNIWLRQTG